MRPIPRQFLTDTVIHLPFVSFDADNNPTFSASSPISYVRCEPSKKDSFKDLGAAKDDKLKLFYDCVNSIPVGKTFAINDRVRFKGKEYDVRDVSEFINVPVSDKVHHYEIFLK